MLVVAIITILIVNRSQNNTELASGAKSSKAALGWHGWPAKAPAPAIAPFNAVLAKQYQEAWAQYLKIDVEYTNTIGMKFRLIPPGEFTMGSTANEINESLTFVSGDQQWQECVESEAPQHKVILTQAIYLGVNEVTQSEYENVMGINPSHFAPMGAGNNAVIGLETGSYPVEMVSWNDAVEFCARLSKQEKLVGETISPLDDMPYRLPTEAQWECACRAGTNTKYWIGDRDEDLLRAGWFGNNCGGRPHTAGELQANPYGLHDIHGNIWEWVQDGWVADYYSEFTESPAVDPVDSTSDGSTCIMRGGAWGNVASSCRAGSRIASGPYSRTFGAGFRVSLAIHAVPRQ